MSTKTLRKRIALVAVAALAVTGLSTVPANAALGASTPTMVSATASTAVGTAAETGFTVVTTGVANTDSIEYTLAITQAPTDSAMALAAPAATSAASAKVAFKTGTEATVAGWTLSTTNTNRRTDTYATNANTDLETADGIRGVISLTPDKAGIYVITLTANGSAGTDGTATFTVYAGYSASASYANTAFPTQGSNISSGWAASNPGQATVRFTNFSTTSTVKYYVTATGASIASYVEQEAIGGAAGDTLSAFANSNNTNLADGFNFTSASSQSADAVDVVIVPNAGSTSATVTVKYFNATTGAETIFSVATVTYGAAVALSAGTSTSLLGSGTGNPAVTGVDDVVTADATAGTQRANVLVTLKDQYSNPVYGQTLSATISGPGLIKWSQATQATAGTVRADSLVLTASQNTAYLGINGDGQGGVATITITVGTTVIATEKVTFFGSATKLVAKAAKPFLSVGANADALEVLATDANGAVANFTVTALSDNIAAVSSTVTNCARATDAEVLLGYTSGAYYCDLNGVALGKAKLTVAPGATSTNSPVVEYQVTGSVAYGVKLSTDKAAYAPGEKITLTISATDIAGNPIGAGSYDFLNGASTASQALTGTAFTDAAFAFNGGKATTTYYAPLVAGPFTFTASLNNSAAVAAAIASTDVKTTATVSADTTVQTQIASLIAAIAKLQKAINKIQKRLNR